uniref:G_PROTEIN_RECEP_F1_2 domain-containing protein n=1 Tax=Macrostomum lignano TaxID=282301 RepID=A0A1I8IW28_9PLAT
TSMDQPWQLNAMQQMSISSYRFSVEINCSSEVELERWSHQNELWFISFYVTFNVLQTLVCLVAVVCNCIAFAALGRVESDCALALQLRSLAVTDTIFVIGNTIDNACHTLESVPAWRSEFFNFVVNRTAACLASIWTVSLSTSVIRCLEVSTVLCLCSDGLYRVAIVASRVFPVYTTIVNYGLQTVTPVVVAVLANIYLLRSLRRRGLRFAWTGQPNRGFDGQQRKDTTRVIVLLLQLYLLCQIPMILFGFNVLLTVPTPVYIVIGLVGNFIASLDGASAAELHRLPAVRCGHGRHSSDCSGHGSAVIYMYCNSLLTQLLNSLDLEGLMNIIDARDVNHPPLELNVCRTMQASGAVTIGAGAAVQQSQCSVYRALSLAGRWEQPVQQPGVPERQPRRQPPTGEREPASLRLERPVGQLHVADEAQEGVEAPAAFKNPPFPVSPASSASPSSTTSYISGLALAPSLPSLSAAIDGAVVDIHLRLLRPVAGLLQKAAEFSVSPGATGPGLHLSGAEQAEAAASPDNTAASPGAKSSRQAASPAAASPAPAKPILIRPTVASMPSQPAAADRQARPQIL